MSECLMPRCALEIFDRDLCESHYAMAYPKELDQIREHITVENNIHPIVKMMAKERYRRHKEKS